MEVDSKTDNDSTNKTGTIRAYFSILHHKGAKTTDPLQGKDRYGGGRSKTTNSLKTTIKKVKKSGQKKGIYGPKGAKSRIGKDFKKKLQRSDSSQMVIGDYFAKKMGIIGLDLPSVEELPGEIPRNL